MRRIEKETLEIINNHRKDDYLKNKKIIEDRRKNLKESLQINLSEFMNKGFIERKIEEFKELYDFEINISFKLEIYEYYTDFDSYFENDPIIQKCKKTHKIN